VHGIKAEAAPLCALLAAEVREQFRAAKSSGKMKSLSSFRVLYAAPLTRAIPDDVIKALTVLTDSTTLRALNGTRVHQYPMKYALVVDSDKDSRGHFFGPATTRPKPRSHFFKSKRSTTSFFSNRWQSKHSVYAEPAGVALAAMEEIERRNLRDCHIVVFTDSVTAKAAINHGGSKSAEVSKIFTDLKFFMFLKLRGITMTAEHMAGTEMIENGTDAASRPTEMVLGELQLSPSMLETLQQWCGTKVSIDLMASAQNAVTTVFISRTYTPEAFATDAFKQDWASLWRRFRHIMLAFPPPGQRSIARTLQQAEAAQAPVMLILPLDPTCSSVARALKISNFRPFLWVPNQQSVAYPHASPLAAWLRKRRASRSISSAEVWTAVILYVKTPPDGSGLVPWTHPEPRRSRCQWIQNLTRQLTEAGARSVISAATWVDTLRAPQT
jgi:hypothetical protein